MDFGMATPTSPYFLPAILNETPSDEFNHNERYSDSDNRNVYHRQRGCRGGIRKQKKIKTIVGNRPGKKHSVQLYRPTTRIEIKPTRDTPIQPKCRGIKTLVVNFHGISNKLESVAELLDTNQPDIIFGSETWVKKSKKVTNSELFPHHVDQYNFWRKDREDGYGGVVLGVKNDILTSPMEQLDADCEIKWVKCEIKGSSPIYLGSYYHPHYNDMDGLNGLAESLEKLPENACIILGGDFNEPDIDWESGTIKSTNERTYKDCTQYCSKLLDIVHDHSLEQMVNFETRNTNTLELLFMTNPTLFESAKPIPGISDHDSIVEVKLHLKTEMQKPKPRRVWKYKSANFLKMEDDLNSYFPQFLLESQDKDINQNWSIFKEKLLNAMEENIPTKNISGKHNLPFINREMKRLIKRKNRAYAKARRTGYKQDKENFRKQRQHVQKSLQKARRQYLNDVIGESLKNNSKAFYSYIKKLKIDSTGIQQLKDSAGKLQSKSETKADILAKQFESVFTHEDLENFPTLESPRVQHTMPEILVENSGVEKLLLNLDTKKATGPDGVPTMVLKELASIISLFLTVIFNQSITEGKVPDEWKKANIVPIYKKGDKTEASNYRPVSLTCVVSKLLEHIVVSAIMNHADNNNILSSAQHGFRAKHSCETQILLTAHDLAEAYSNKVQIDMVVLDFQKAFDKVPHQRLLYKLDHYGIRGNTLNWVGSFLAGRTQTVIMEGAVSLASEVTSGVPQGTVMGPVLFLLYINDLPNNISSTVRLFADDCVVYREITSMEDSLRLQDDLNQLNVWEEKWQMNFNTAKCAVLRFSVSQTPVINEYTIHGGILIVEKEFKYLGVLISDNWKWSAHIDAMVKKANQKLCFVRRNTKGMPRAIKEAAYKTLVRPHLEYCASAWDPYTQQDIDKIEKVQRRAARYVSGDYKPLSSVTQMIRDLGWDTLEQRRTQQSLVMAYQILSEEVAIPKDVFFRVHPTITRSNNGRNLLPKHPRANVDKHSFACRIVTKWNKLPASVVKAPSTIKFKELLHNMLPRDVNSAT